LSHGLCALMIEARDPWLVLERSLRSSVRIIVNHCPSVLLGIGHYSVLVGLDDESVTLHDPADMPGRTIPRGEFWKLWNPSHPNREILNQVLVAISDSPSTPGVCPLCDRGSVESLACGACGKRVHLQPAVVLGCLSDGCAMRSWERIFCSSCDHHRRDGLPRPGGRGRARVRGSPLA
jgi:hypothetical protein